MFWVLIDGVHGGIELPTWVEESGFDINRWFDAATVNLKDDGFWVNRCDKQV